MAKTGIKSAVPADVGVGITVSIIRIDLPNLVSKPGKVYIAMVFEDTDISEIK